MSSPTKQPQPPKEKSSSKKQPHPLRVSVLESTMKSQSNQSDFASPSPRSRPKSTPRKEKTVVGMGTHGLGQRSQALHDEFQKLMYSEWCARKKEERQQKEAAEQPNPMATQKKMTAKEKIEYRKALLAHREAEKDYRAKVLATEFAEVRHKMKEDHQRQKLEDVAFVKNYSADNVASAREQLHSSQQRRQRLQNLHLPELESQRQEFREEKQTWEELFGEQVEKWENSKNHRRQYVLDMKEISQQNLVDDREERRAAVAAQREELRLKEQRRKEEREAHRAALAEDAKEGRARQKAKFQTTMYNQHLKVQDIVEKRRAEFKAMDEPIHQAREEWLESMKAIVKERVESARGPGSAAHTFRSSRHALASDLRAETARNRQERQREREELLESRKALHDEGYEKAMERRRKLRERNANSISPSRSVGFAA